MPECPAKIRCRFGIVSFAGLLLMAPPISAGAQEPSAVIAGRVTEAESGHPLARALVTIEGTALRATTDSAGVYRMPDVPAGPRVVVVRFLGYAPARIAVVVPASGVLTVDAILARTALAMPEITVTADPTGRATGELATATVIERDAIDNQTATSLMGVLELIPGMPLRPPGLDGVEQVSLRSIPTGATASLTAGGPTANDVASLGTLIIVDGVPLSNNANLQAAGPRGELNGAYASTAGGGIDLRRIPASTIERVEVIRGVPSARYGDLTQGAIVVETRAGTVSPRVAARGDERTLGASGVLGAGLGRGSLTANADVTRTLLNPGQTDDAAFRFAGQLAHRLALGGDPSGPRATILDSHVDGFILRQESPERPELFPGRTSWNDDAGLRISERLRAPLGADGGLRVIASVDYLRQRSFAQASRVRGAIPFTDRLTEGTQEGRYLLGEYLAAVDLDGDVWNLFTQAEVNATARFLGAGHELLGGIELRREWNAGDGYMFDIEFPPQVTFNGVEGFDRPRPYDSIPPQLTTSLYVDDRISGTLGPISIGLQAGMRLDLLHAGSRVSDVADAVLQPRLNLELTPSRWFRLRGGWGRTAKSPTQAQRYPAPQYFDVVNLNWFTPDPAERLAILTTFIRSPENPDLGFSEAVKREVGFEVGGARGGGALGLVYFHDGTSGAIGYNPTPGYLVRDLYDLADSTIGTGSQPPVIAPPTRADTVPILLDMPANVLTLDNRGWELTATFPTIRPLGLQLQVQGAFVRTRFQSDALDFGRLFRDFQMDGSDPRSPYWTSILKTAERTILTYRLVHHQPALGLVVTAVVQHVPLDVRADVAATDTLSFTGYITRTGDLVPVPLERRGDPEYEDLRVQRAGVSAVSDTTAADWMASLQVRKTLPAGGQLSFYAFNVFDRLGRLDRSYPSLRFGIEVSMPLGGALGTPWAP